jgi:predicted pyridoxine 5'-phosphate oxidase superfamily flavin-nucleotide-binding protein
MAKLSEEVKTAIDKAATACVATVDTDAVANVVFVSYLKYQDDETIIIADNKFNKTRMNLSNNPKLAFVVLDTETKKSYQIKGSVKSYSDGEKYQAVVDWVHVKHPQTNPTAAIYVDVEEVYCGSEKIA